MKPFDDTPKPFDFAPYILIFPQRRKQKGAKVGSVNERLEVSEIASGGFKRTF